MKLVAKMKNNFGSRSARAVEAITRLKKLYSEDVSHLGSLSDETPFQILVTTILSARTKDENTEKASEQLFSEYKTPKQIASAPLKEIARLIKPSGFYKNKARHIKKTAKMILEKFGGKVPQTMEELMRLPGVGRKVAGCVLVYAFGIPALPVDVHVFRVAHRIGFAEAKTPEKTEKELEKIIPKEYWIVVNELLVLHGQNVCFARKPDCGRCPLRDLCDYYKNKIKR
jgi:endonuclease-3